MEEYKKVTNKPSKRWKKKEILAGKKCMCPAHVSGRLSRQKRKRR